ncbi:MAG: Trk family potassium uptake protein [Clostridia bacterium]|nr:Trk family potassium uptake protein [Clostridia bacterium]
MDSFEAEGFKKKRILSPWILIIAGFAAVILLGAGLLMLPFASSGTPAPFGDALFTSVSAVCVTGLVVRDTATCWSGFGQAVLLLLIQIGGLGVVTVAASLTILSGKRISLFTRSTIKSTMAAPQLGGIVRLTKFVLRGTFLVELAGAILIMPSMIIRYGARGIWLSVFHSVSAFCNAGFDIMGRATGAYSSLTSFAADPFVTVPVMLLILIGGIGFITWDDFRTHKFRFSKYSMQSKAALTVSGILILIPVVILFFVDYKGLPMGERVLCSLFQAVTPRTAGFNTADLTRMSGPTKGLTTALMLIGGSPGSTAGGMKTTTIAVLAAVVASTFNKNSEVHMFKRRVEPAAVKTAATLFMMYLTLFFTGACAISLIEGIPMSDCAFETASALGTVGLTMGITPLLGTASRCILMALMFMGRVGGLTLIYAFLPGAGTVRSKYPLENITIG